MNVQQYSIRLERPQNEAHELWWENMEILGWNRWHSDLDTYLKASQTEAMLLGNLGPVPIGHVLAAIYRNEIGWIGLFVIQPQHRGRFYGKLLFDAAMDQFEMHTTKIVGLDSVAERKSTYEKRGFVASRLGKIRCMSCTLSTYLSDTTDLSVEISMSNLRLVDLVQIPHGILAHSDYEHTGFRRDALWSKGLERADVFGFALIKKVEPIASESLHGWVAVRRASKGFRLGPLYATNAADSCTLIMAAMQAAAIRASNLAGTNVDLGSESSIAAEVWGGNQDAVASFERLGWECTGIDYHRMWLNGIATPQQDQFGLAQRGMFAIFDAVVG